MSENDLNPVVLCESDLLIPQITAIAGGQAVLFSRRCPGHETVNEDSVAAIPVSPTSGALVIADGVGGMQAGHTASAVAVDSLLSRLRNPELIAGQLRSAILDGIELANEHICGMGANAATTLAVIEIDGDRIRPYHVGDSMILLCGQKGKLRWQSISHSPVGYAVESGMMDESDAMSHPERHVVSNVVGNSEMRIEVGPPLKMNARDTLLMCSDGLSDNLTTDEIVSIIRHGDLQAAVARLVEMATDRMLAVDLRPDHPSKPDDLTIVAYRRTLTPRTRQPPADIRPFSE